MKIITYAMLRVNFPLVSSSDSFLPDSTPKRLIFPRWLPEAKNLESGEKQTVQASTEKEGERELSNNESF